ncbi:MAG: protein arginine kinase [Candidatus Omnitrophota bacterium]
MVLNDLLKRRSEWLKGEGPLSDIVISSRIRLARNIEKCPFPHWGSKEKEENVLNMVLEAVKKISQFKNVLSFRLVNLDNVDKQFLIERHLMSHELALRSNHKALILTEDEVVSLMVNEEDHLRLQVMKSGFNLDGAWKIIDEIDTALSEELNFAYLADLGYLTACPTNTGTGMRGSVMLHLPALVMTKQINRILAAVAKLSFNVRGLYGEGTQASGNFFQVSNQVSLGLSEGDIISNIKSVIRQIADQEQAARQKLLTQHLSTLQDRVFRAFGILENAHIISSNETIELLSMVRLGLDLKLLRDIDKKLLNELLILTQPAHLQKISGKKLTPTERDSKRASLIRERLIHN